MAQTLTDQIITIERALGERMIDHALVIIRAWMNELGENNPYEQAYSDIEEQYNKLFAEWLTSDDPKGDEILDGLTGDTYRLTDAVYLDIRLKRGIAPEMHGFNKQSHQSILQYFSYCPRFTEEDWKWFREVNNDSNYSAVALLAVASLAKNIREAFNEQALFALIEGINGANEVVAEQCLANVIILLAHYDVRIDYFPEIQNAFLEAIHEHDDDAEEAFRILGAMISSCKTSWQERISSGEMTIDDLPEELRNLLELTGSDDSMEGVVSWVPASEQEYMQGLIEILPDTWVYSELVGEDQDRVRAVAFAYLSIGRMDLLWEHIEEASSWLVRHLRKGSNSPKDYINYGHCLMLKGDRMMAYETYRQARTMCKNSKEFFALFRPDRRALVDHGIPVEIVYLIEDKLLSVN